MINDVSDHYSILLLFKILNSNEMCIFTEGMTRGRVSLIMIPVLILNKDGISIHS